MRERGLAPGVVYTLGSGGWLLLKRLGYEPHGAKREHAYHDLGLVEIRLHLEALCRRDPSWNLTWYPERAASFYASPRDRQPTLVPDALIVLRRGEGPTQETLAALLEFDASREAHGRPSSDFGRKFKGYDAFFGKWDQHPVVGNLPYFPWVMIVTHGEERLQNLAKALLNHRQKRVGYALTLMTDLQATPDFLAAPIWMLVKPGENEIMGRERSQRQTLATNKAWLAAVRKKPTPPQQPLFSQPLDDEPEEVLPQPLQEPPTSIETVAPPPVLPATPNTAPANTPPPAVNPSEQSIPASPATSLSETGDTAAGSPPPLLDTQMSERLAQQETDQTSTFQSVTPPTPAVSPPPAENRPVQPPPSLQPPATSLFTTLSQLGARSLSFLPHTRTPAEQLLSEARSRFEQDAKAKGWLCHWRSPLNKVATFFQPPVTPPAALLTMQHRSDLTVFMLDVATPETDWVGKVEALNQMAEPSCWNFLPEFKDTYTFPSLIILTSTPDELSRLVKELLPHPRPCWFLLTALTDFRTSPNVLFDYLYVPIRRGDTPKTFESRRMVLVCERKDENSF